VARRCRLGRRPGARLRRRRGVGRPRPAEPGSSSAPGVRAVPAPLSGRASPGCVTGGSTGSPAASATRPGWPPWRRARRGTRPGP